MMSNQAKQHRVYDHATLVVRTQLTAYTHTTLNFHNGDERTISVGPHRPPTHQSPSRGSPDSELAPVVLLTRNTMLRQQRSMDADAVQAHQDCTPHHMERPTTDQSLIAGPSRHISTCSPP